jgi:hypothetical protein
MTDPMIKKIEEAIPELRRCMEEFEALGERFGDICQRLDGPVPLDQLYGRQPRINPVFTSFETDDDELSETDKIFDRLLRHWSLATDVIELGFRDVSECLETMIERLEEVRVERLGVE